MPSLSLFYAFSLSVLCLLSLSILHRLFSRFLTNADVEGVYEAKIPLMFKFIMAAGCVCRVARHVRDKDKHNNMYTLDHLQFMNTTECEYLENCAYKRIFIYHSRSGDRGVFGCFCPDGNSPATGTRLCPRARARTVCISLLSCGRLCMLRVSCCMLSCLVSFLRAYVLVHVALALGLTNSLFVCAVQCVVAACMAVCASVCTARL